MNPDKIRMILECPNCNCEIDKKIEYLDVILENLESVIQAHGILNCFNCGEIIKIDKIHVFKEKEL